MKKIIIFTNKPISHFIPIKKLIIQLVKRGNKVWCLGDVTNKENIISTGANFLEYPSRYFENNNQEYFDSISDKIENALINNNYDEAIFYKMKQDIAFPYKNTNYQFDLLLNIVKEINPDFIFRDSVDKFSKIIAKELNIKCIGYITNNMYKNEVFEKDKFIFYNCFLNYIPYEIFKKSNITYSNFIADAKAINKFIAKELEQKEIELYGQYETNELLNIVCSIDSIQPQYNCDNTFLIRENGNEYDNLAKYNINSDLKEFINKNKKIIYIATGSFIKRKDEYYINLINIFKDTEYSLVIAWNTDEENIQKYSTNNVYIARSVNQKYVLKNSILFISMGGLNSILESIFFKVPLLIIPLIAEQKLNGIIVEDLNIGRTVISKKNINKSIKNIFYEIIENKDIIDKLERISLEMKSNNPIRDIEQILNKIGL